MKRIFLTPALRAGVRSKITWRWNEKRRSYRLQYRYTYWNYWKTSCEDSDGHMSPFKSTGTCQSIEWSYHDLRNWSNCGKRVVGMMGWWGSQETYFPFHTLDGCRPESQLSRLPCGLTAKPVLSERLRRYPWQYNRSIEAGSRLLYTSDSLLRLWSKCYSQVYSVICSCWRRTVKANHTWGCGLQSSLSPVRATYLSRKPRS